MGTLVALHMARTFVPFALAIFFSPMFYLFFHWHRSKYPVACERVTELPCLLNSTISHFHAGVRICGLAISAGIMMGSDSNFLHK